MYIDKYWEISVGSTDDAMTFVDYLEFRNKKEVSLKEIFEETGLSKLNGNYRQTDVSLEVKFDNCEAEIHYAIDTIGVLAALILECKVNGYVNLHDLDSSKADFCIIIIEAEAESNMIITALKDYVENTCEYDIVEMMTEDELKDVIEGTESLYRELIERS